MNPSTITLTRIPPEHEPCKGPPKPHTLAIKNIHRKTLEAKLDTMHLPKRHESVVYSREHWKKISTLQNTTPQHPLQLRLPKLLTLNPNTLSPKTLNPQLNPKPYRGL